MIEIKNLNVSVEDKSIITDMNLKIEKGKVYAIMGPNGSGKSTIANVLMGHPKYTATGSILLDSEEIIEMSPDARAKKGLFLSFQYPVSVSGVTLTNFLRMSYNTVKTDKLSVVGFHKMVKEKMKFLNVDSSFGRRYLNEGFSGGEKKKAEILQMLVLESTYCILDETDSGLDVDALKTVAEGINVVRSSERAVVLITHYNRILKYVNPDVVLVLVDGKIVATGGHELAIKIEEEGYKEWTKKK